MPKYTKKERETFSMIKLHLKALNERSRRLNSLVKHKRKRGDYNRTDLKKLLRKIKSAKKRVADAEFI